MQGRGKRWLGGLGGWDGGSFSLSYESTLSM